MIVNNRFAQNIYKTAPLLTATIALLGIASCTCRIDKFVVSQPPAHYAIEREYFLNPRRLVDLDKSSFAAIHVYADSGGSIMRFVKLDLRSDNRDVLMLVEPAASPSDWLYEAIIDGKKEDPPRWFYDSDYYKRDGTNGVIFSNGRIFADHQARHVFLDLYPTPRPSGLAAITDQRFVDPIIVSRRSSGLGKKEESDIQEFSVSSGNWLPTVRISCDFANLNVYLGLNDVVIVPCSPGLALYEKPGNRVRYVRFPGIKKALLFQAFSSPTNDEALLSAANLDGPITTEYFHFRNGTLAPIPSWSGVRIRDFEWRADGRLLVATDNFVGTADGIGKRINPTSLAGWRCMLRSAPDDSFVHAFCGRPDAQREPSADAESLHHRDSSVSFLSAVFQSSDGGANWHEITSELGF